MVRIMTSAMDKHQLNEQWKADLAQQLKEQNEKKSKAFFEKKNCEKINYQGIPINIPGVDATSMENLQQKLQLKDKNGRIIKSKIDFVIQGPIPPATENENSTFSYGKVKSYFNNIRESNEEEFGKKQRDHQNYLLKQIEEKKALQQFEKKKEQEEVSKFESSFKNSNSITKQVMPEQNNVADENLLNGFKRRSDPNAKHIDSEEERKKKEMIYKNELKIQMEEKKKRELAEKQMEQTAAIQEQNNNSKQSSSSCNINNKTFHEIEVNTTVADEEKHENAVGAVVKIKKSRIPCLSKKSILKAKLKFKSLVSLQPLEDKSNFKIPISSTQEIAQNFVNKNSLTSFPAGKKAIIDTLVNLNESKKAQKSPKKLIKLKKIDAKVTLRAKDNLDEKKITPLPPITKDTKKVKNVETVKELPIKTKLDKSKDLVKLNKAEENRNFSKTEDSPMPSSIKTEKATSNSSVLKFTQNKYNEKIVNHENNAKSNINTVDDVKNLENDTTVKTITDLNGTVYDDNEKVEDKKDKNFSDTTSNHKKFKRKLRRKNTENKQSDVEEINIVDPESLRLVKYLRNFENVLMQEQVRISVALASNDM
ncbi:hypothetical protein HDU92_002384 [Lobulomyces angularis]|nr:hypothetical protein HDU92_002384 [Lobulomyces angularis]